MTSPNRGPFVQGTIAGLALPGAVLIVLAFAGELRAWLVEGAVYGLMPLFALLGVASYALTRRLKAAYARRGQRALSFTHGLLVGSWVVGAALMWSAMPGRDPSARLLSAASGGVMLVAFWVWVGSILAHYEPRAVSPERRLS